MLANYLSRNSHLHRSWKALVLSLILLQVIFVPSVIAQDDASATEVPARLCQVHHLIGSLPANIFADADVNSAIIGRVPPDTNLCVYGVAENDAEWFEINPAPDAEEVAIGFILQSALRVGEPGTIADTSAYCDAWQVSSAASINVRSCARTSCSVVTTLNPNEIVCADNYAYTGGNWYQVREPVSGASGWLLSSQLTFDYDEGTGCPEESYRVLEQATIHSCTDATCATANSFTPGTLLCVTSDAYEGASWIRYAIGDVPVGWVRNDLMAAIDSDLTLEDVISASTANDENITPVADDNVSVATATPSAQDNAPVATATPAGTLAPGVQVCPVGTNPVVAGQCATVTPTTFGLTPQAGNGLLLAQTIGLNDLFVDNLELLSPQGSSEFGFSLPDDWVVRGPVTLTLDIDYNESLSSVNDEIDVANANLSTRLDIRLDNILISTVNLSSGDVGRRQIEVVLPTELLSDQTSRFHTIELELSAQDYCRANAETRITINSTTSFLRAVYEEAIPILELGRYPIPFYNSPIGLEQESVWFVLADDADDSQLQVAASIAAGLGHLTGNELLLNAIYESQITDELYRNNNLILIGEPNDNTLIANLYAANALPTRLDSSGNILFEGSALTETEGVIQLAPNPENPNKTILVVTSTGIQGLQQAGRALGGPPSLLGLSGDVAVITDATPRFRGNTPGEDLPIGMYRFSDFDVTENIVMVGAGLKSSSFNFDVPLGGDLREDAYLEILFNATNSANLETSSFNVVMNDVPISGVSLSNVINTEMTTDVQLNRETLQVEFSTLRIPIPEGVIEPGRKNDITFVVDMGGQWECDIPNFIWSTVSKDSLMFIPQNALNEEDIFPLVSNFPIPFNIFPNLQDVWISLPEQPSDIEVEQLIRLMSSLGDSIPLAEGIIPIIQTGDLPAGTDLSDYHFIVLGRPTENSFLASMNEQLPQPFFTDSDELLQEYDDVTYRLGSGANIGVLQILKSPWNPDRVALVITGTSEIGQEFAGNTLITSIGRSSLDGNIVFSAGYEPNPVDTRFVFSELEILETVTNTNTVASTATAIDMGPPSATASFTPDPLVTVSETSFTIVETTNTPSPRPTLVPRTLIPDDDGGEWLNIVLAVLGLAIVLVLGIGGIRALQARGSAIPDEDV